MKKFLATAGMVGFLSVVGTAFAAVTAINVGSQTGTLTSGTAGTSTYVISFTKSNGAASVSDLSVSGLPAGVSYALSATSSSVTGAGPVPDVTLTLMTTNTASAGTTTFTVTSGSPVLSATGSLVIGAVATIQSCNGSTFDTFVNGTVNAQGGWHVSGPFDQAVVDNSYGYATFGCKTLRISNATTSPFIFNQTFSNSSTNEAGELNSLDSNGATGTPRNRFEAQFDLASVMQSEQPGMHLSVSPDRADGTRMSALGFSDTASGIDVFFDDVTGTTSPVTFNEVQVASALSRTVPHTIKFLIDFVEGASNDIVKIFIDGNLVHTGTSWENFYRYDADAFPTPNPNLSRTVRSLVFYEQAPGFIANQANGFLIDNVSLLATSTPSTGTTTPPASTSTPPVITLSGSSTMNLFLNSVFTDPGATAVDSASTSVPVTATGTVDTGTVGGYTILYTATDANSNVATATRTVNIISTSTPPIITLNGSASMNVTVNTTFTDPGATAVDAIGNSVPVVATGTVNTTTVGDYVLTYTATDTNSNVATTTRTVHIIAAPVPPAGGSSSTGGGGGFFIFSPLPGQNPISTTPTTGSPIVVGTVSTPQGEVLGVAAFHFTRNLKFGSRGDDVMELQKLLIAGGDLVINVPTKYFGKLTQKALAKWQKRNKIPATGYFGPISRAFLSNR